MNHYCTYFDRGYLAQGVALWRSLARYDADATLHVLAMDGETAGVLRGFGDERLRVLDLHVVVSADCELQGAQRSRPRAEFFFLLTPCLLRHLFRAGPEIDRLMYLDADLLFFGGPAVIWTEFERGSVLTVPHRYPPWHDDSSFYGRFNVGVVVFRRDESAFACIERWRGQCLASTALTANGLEYGDQKYLDEWPQRFDGVIVSTNSGVNVAPWNWAVHRFEVNEGSIQVDGASLIVFHFAQFKKVSATWFDSGQLEYGVMPRRLRAAIYETYWRALIDSENAIRRISPGFAIPVRGWPASLGRWHLAALRLFWGQFWCRGGGAWFAMGTGLGRWSGHFLGWYRRNRKTT